MIDNAKIGALDIDLFLVSEDTTLRDSVSKMHPPAPATHSSKVRSWKSADGGSSAPYTLMPEHSVRCFVLTKYSTVCCTMYVHGAQPLFRTRLVPNPLSDTLIGFARDASGLVIRYHARKNPVFDDEDED